jgi:neutral ceramidase
MGDSGVRRAIVANLSATYPGIYGDSNIAFIGTHQHAGVGGYVEVCIRLLYLYSS